MIFFIFKLLLIPVYWTTDTIGLYSLLTGHKKWAKYQFILFIIMLVLIKTPLIYYLCFAKLFLLVIGFFTVYFPSFKNL